VNARESFTGLLLAEWTKLRSVTRWVVTLLASAVLTIGLSFLAASGSISDLNKHTQAVTGPHGQPVTDNFSFVHQQVTGDTTLTVRVTAPTPLRETPDDRAEQDPMTPLADPSPFAQPAAGIMVKDGTRPGSSYAAVLLTAAGAVHQQWDYDTDRKGSTGNGARWLRLVRSGATVTGYESADGATWHKIAIAVPRTLPPTLEIGFYVSSPPQFSYRRGGGSSSLGARPTTAQASFDHVQLSSAGSWRQDTVGMPAPDKAPPGAPPRPAEKDGPAVGTVTVTDGRYALHGTGAIATSPADDDMVEIALVGVIAGLLAVIAVGVLFATSEYRRGMIRTTFAATPRRGRVLAAKALVLGATTFVAGLVGTFGSFLLAVPVMRRHGFTRPMFPRPSLADGPVLRALLLTAAFMAGVALVGLGIGLLLRHSAAAITVTVLLVLAPLIAGMIMPGTSPKWLMYTTLGGGMATQRAKPPTVTLAEPWALIGPWAGIGVVAAWVVVVLGLAWWQLRRRDA
jgi:hypothetical protein